MCVFAFVCKRVCVYVCRKAASLVKSGNIILFTNNINCCSKTTKKDQFSQFNIYCFCGLNDCSIFPSPFPILLLPPLLPFPLSLPFITPQPSLPPCHLSSSSPLPYITPFFLHLLSTNSSTTFNLFLPSQKHIHVLFTLSTQNVF